TRPLGPSRARRWGRPQGVCWRWDTSIGTLQHWGRRSAPPVARRPRSPPSRAELPCYARLSMLPITEFILRNYKNFNSRATRDAFLAYHRHIEAGGRMFWAVAGAMSSAQLGITMAPAIREGLIHGLSVTGANLEESLFRLVAHDSYKDFPE